MKENKQIVLITAANLLSYPSAQWKESVYDLQLELQEEILSDELERDVHQAIQPILLLSEKDLRETYVSTFDLSNRSGLYLTAHELGDSPKRGAALIRLKKLVEQAGFTIDDQELGDYIPMLFELLAVAPETEEIHRLENRLSVAVQRIKSNLDEDHPYYGVFQLLMKYALSIPTTEEIEAMENSREKADLEELPYPIMYQ